jgi:Ala-tRNA(Pro) deacylase
MDSRLKTYLDERGISYVEHEHEEVFTVKESRELKRDIPGLHCKCLFLKSDRGDFYLVGLPAEKRLDVFSLRKRLRVRKLHFGKESDLLKKLKLKPGSVSIFGLINNKERDVRFILDKEVWDAEIVGFHPNVNTATLEIKHGDLKKYFNSLENDKEVLEL